MPNASAHASLSSILDDWKAIGATIGVGSPHASWVALTSLSSAGPLELELELNLELGAALEGAESPKAPDAM